MNEARKTLQVIRDYFVESQHALGSTNDIPANGLTMAEAYQIMRSVNASVMMLSRRIDYVETLIKVIDGER